MVSLVSWTISLEPEQNPFMAEKIELYAFTDHLHWVEPDMCQDFCQE